MFCPPAGAKYPFFQAPAHGLIIVKEDLLDYKNLFFPKEYKK